MTNSRTIASNDIDKFWFHYLALGFLQNLNLNSKFFENYQMIDIDVWYEYIYVSSYDRAKHSHMLLRNCFTQLTYAQLIGYHMKIAPRSEKWVMILFDHVNCFTILFPPYMHFLSTLSHAALHSLWSYIMHVVKNFPVICKLIN